MCLGVTQWNFMSWHIHIIIYLYIYIFFFHYILFIQSNFSHVSNCRYAKLHTIHFSITKERMN